MILSDYSSIIFDAQALGKPVYLFCKDIEGYIKNRGLYPEFERMFKDDIYVSEFILMRDIKRHINQDKGTVL